MFWIFAPGFRSLSPGSLVPFAFSQKCLPSVLEIKLFMVARKSKKGRKRPGVSIPFGGMAPEI